MSSSAAGSRFPVQSCDSKRIDCVQVYGPKWTASAGSSSSKTASASSSTSAVSRLTSRVRWYHVIFGVLYVYQLGWLVSTMGEPYRLFLEKADREGLAVMQGSTIYRAELEHSFGDLNDPNRRTQKLSWTSWMDYDMEELVEEKKKDAQQSVIDSLSQKERVPHKLAPAFLPSLIMGMLCTLHALVILMQHWSVAVLVWMNYKELDVTHLEIPDTIMEYDYEQDAKDKELPKAAAATSDPTKKKSIAVAPIPAHKIPSYLPTHARVVPAKEKPVLVPLEFFPTLGMTFEYHRRRYLFVKNGPDDYVWTKIRCRTDLPLSFLAQTWKGFASTAVVQAATIRYGPNIFEVKQPEFMELYKAQLINPFTVFQLFCVLLWAIDDYLIYSFFSLFMVLLFEGTVVFQRLKSLQALRGMGNPTRPVYVYREDKWTAIASTDLLPGDIISLTRQMPKKNKNDDKKRKTVTEDGGDVVPADLLLLRGSTVVNEASLTGESVPQMKEGLADLSTATTTENTTTNDDDVLDMKNKHKMNVAYAGTRMLQCLSGDSNEKITQDGEGGVKSIPNPPDNGAVCFVLRTGFSSAQGKLVRMIEGSQEKVKGHERDTGLLLLVLCFFAIASSSYVLYHGLQDEGRSQYELLLHCIMIVTSVIRPELPMQMAMAVNNSLMTLMKMHVFCTEPYRVPMAGKLDACLFDKTGTLTTDELVAVGVLDNGQLSKNSKNDKLDLTLKPMIQVHNEAALVMAGCHSLVVFDEETTGDPLEMAALKSIRWHVTADGKTEPMPQGSGSSQDDKKDAKKTTTAAGPAKVQLPAGQPIRVPGKAVTTLEILVRHHFSSKLQRMSCVIRSGSTHYSVAKGSPEAIGQHLQSKPTGYDATSEALAKEGYRVIALAYKSLDASVVEEAKDSRAKCETDLTFAGFIAFTCRVRKDTASVLHRLKEGGMSVAMVTGDALLTAIHVAKEVYICETVDGKMIDPMDEVKKESDEMKALLIQKRIAKGEKVNLTKEDLVYRPILYLESIKSGLTWKSYESGDTFGDYDAEKVPELSKTHDLATTGKCLTAAFEFDHDGTRKVLGYFKVFARMTPDAKETVIECLHSVNSLCMMCGDGANDVGALKQADVGVALLSGFGNVNVDRTDEKEESDDQTKQEPEVTAIMSQEHLDQLRALPVSLIKMRIKQLGVDPTKYPDLVEKEDLVKLYQIKAREVAVKRHDQKNAKDRSKMTKAEQQAEQKAKMLEKQQRMAERVRELEAQGESWAQFKAMKEFMNEEFADAKKKKAAVANSRGIEGSAASLAAQLEEMDTGESPVVKLGDASIAAPFTSKMPSIRNCVDIVRQGRCTLVSSIQMYQILALQSLISSYSLSVLYLSGVKYGDTQMTALGLLGSVSFILLGQFAIHLLTMIVAVEKAKEHLPPDHSVDLDGSFKPGMLNTVVFLVSSVQQVTVFVVNLQGRPFMTGVSENRPLLWSLLSTFILTFMFASESVPAMNRYFQLIPFPDDATREFILTILAMDLIATYVFDLLMKFIFARHILIASFKETTWSEIFKLLRTFAVIAFLMYSFLGSDETWEEMERAMAELEGTLMENATAAADAVEAAAESVGECIGDACEAVAETVADVAENVKAAVHDEF
ncbi:Probable manganese-transporting ATPase catp-8 [Seminavis robusta]|uniref:Probable manganese-transporting ATPase catp-8 n=1 Tax=Seminavis robusta TaxID=568900 RepID=A0A9N8H1S2_9STRA|nr:Probable manganese-transporting ATPase catp-8 [Seminavis robusta]|eukprot:Sro7_g005870.1 Probable manganese-transporting ATPase catp-8 (1623) ;mRNA; f:65982-71510